MNQKVKQCLEGKQGSYIFPFLWLHGEPKERLRQEILAIKNSGISEFCAESRPYEDFCQDAWWDDFGYILETARDLGMRVWLLDDRHFPTGYANGYLESPERAHLRKKLIRERQIEVLGPMKCAKLCIDGWKEKPTEHVSRVIAYRHTDRKERLEYATAVDLTDRLTNGMITWDIPAGVWRVCVMLETTYGGYNPERQDHYIDMLNADSCRAMLEAVYEPHYAHFKEYFGNTFAGFFSDEPGFFNRTGTYHNTLGLMYEKYPWRPDLPSLIAENAGMSEKEIALALPALWEDLGEITAAIRMHYMDVVTKLYRENFSYLLGNWCRDHGVMYIGHVIEDCGAHMRLGYGAGHFFRALDGQDMAGMDIVLHQDIPGITDCIHRSLLDDNGVTDPAFFHYTLPKLAASHAHIQPLKQGRAMCEIFGAFGWAEGLPYMKGLADVTLASGINHFVPHAFSPREEDWDCPPHFYNGGHNIQYPLFGRLMAYMARTAHVLSGGIHQADVAVFYNAESEWTSGKRQPFSEICRELTQNMIDFDILPYDALKDARIENCQLLVNGEKYGALIVSESDILPYDRLSCFSYLCSQGLPVIFTEDLPHRSAEGNDIKETVANFEVAATKELPALLREKQLCHVRGEGIGLRHLRFYHVSENGEDVYMFSNEAIHENVDAFLTLPHSGDYLIYDPWDNLCYRGRTDGQGRLPLRLEKGNAVLVIFGGAIPADLPMFRFEAERKPLPLRFDISVRAEGETEFHSLANDSELFDISGADRLPDFCGEVCYHTKLTVEKGYTVLDLGEVGEIAEAWLNGSYLGARINAPYKFSLRDFLKDGENDLRIVVKSNLAHRRCDHFSKLSPIPPTGILGELAICRYEECEGASV